MGRGTFMVLPANPNGTLVGCANCGDAAIESIRKRFSPVSVHNSAGLDGQSTCFNSGKRTRFASGCQSPGTPAAVTGRNRSGPKADDPNALAGSSVANTVCASCSVIELLAKVREVTKPPSAAPTSMVSSRGNCCGATDFKKKLRCPYCGKSLSFPKCINAELPPGFTAILLLSNATCGREGAIVTGTSNTRSSFK